MRPLQAKIDNLEKSRKEEFHDASADEEMLAASSVEKRKAEGGPGAASPVKKDPKMAA
jgi:hypothetical protein